MRVDNLQVWRDHDARALRLGEFMRVGSLAPAADAAALAGNVFDAGGRLVVVGGVVDFDALGADDALGFVALLRELTSYGIAVEWQLKATLGDSRWRDLWHLPPPSEALLPAGAPTATWEFWRAQFYYGLCTMRRGPGMIEVRDRRQGRLRCLRFTSPLHIAEIERLEKGAPAWSFDQEVLAEFEAARLVLARGDLRLWLPCRSRRSPLSPIAFW
jgi:hypothetical protein